MRARFCPSLGSLSPSLPHGGVLASLGKVAPAARGNPAGAEILLLEGTPSVSGTWNLLPQALWILLPSRYVQANTVGKNKARDPLYVTWEQNDSLEYFKVF